MGMSTMASYLSRRFLSSSGRNASRYIVIEENEFEKLRTLASKAEASNKEGISKNKPYPVDEGEIRAGRPNDYESWVWIYNNHIVPISKTYCGALIGLTLGEMYWRKPQVEEEKKAVGI